MKRLSWLFSLVFLALGCQENQNDDLFKDTSGKSREAVILHKFHGANARTTETGVNCGETHILPLLANDLVVGSVEITVDQTNITLHYDLTGMEWFLYDLRVFAGNCDSIPAFSDYPYFESFPQSPETREFTLVIPLANLPECGCIDEIVTVARYNPSTSQLELLTTTLNKEYCSCVPPEDDKNLRTQTPGGWGAPPNGDNPGTYLHKNFAGAFPAGLVVGCTYTITFTSAQAITDGLPSGGTPSALTKSYLNPTEKPKDPNNPKNTLAMHVVALKLSVTFDAFDEDFGASSTKLANAVVTSGDFKGWTVAQVLAEAEKVLGGCASSYTPSQMTTVLTAINSAYDDGTTNTGFLENQ
jgi:hypothetical protein